MHRIMHRTLGVMLLATVVALTACDKPTPTTGSADKPTSKTPPAPVVKSEADKAWDEVVNSMREPSIPPHWETNAPSRAELAAFEQQTGLLAANVAEKARDFYTRFPSHTDAAEAREQEYQLLSLAAQFGDTNSANRVAKLEETQLEDPKLSEDDRLQIRLQQLQRSVMTARDAGEEVSVADLEAGVRKLQKEFPNRPEPQALLLSAAQGWLEKGELEKSRTLARELAASDSAEVKEAADVLVKKLERLGKPLDIKFTSVDGRTVDLANLKGKVVLIDFWATWCKPCMVELPNLKAAYERLHARGFEIVGISLDRNKAALERVTQSETMSWAQSFGESSSQLAEEFGVESIPTMWLVDKKGNLRDLNARQDLAAKVEKLLNEPSE